MPPQSWWHLRPPRSAQLVAAWSQLADQTPENCRPLGGSNCLEFIYIYFSSGLYRFRILFLYYVWDSLKSFPSRLLLCTTDGVFYFMEDLNFIGSHLLIPNSSAYALGVLFKESSLVPISSRLFPISSSIRCSEHVFFFNYVNPTNPWSREIFWYLHQFLSSKTWSFIIYVFHFLGLSTPRYVILFEAIVKGGFFLISFLVPLSF